MSIFLFKLLKGKGKKKKTLNTAFSKGTEKAVILILTD